MNRGIRPAIVLNPLDRLAYQAIVDDLSLDAIGRLPKWVYGWRMARDRPSKGNYQDNKSEWREFRNRVSNNSKKYEFIVHIDVNSFFSSINTEMLINQMSRSYRNSGVIDRLEAFFEIWHTRANGSGIPQRSLSSSVLAHAVLSPLDTYLERLVNSDARSRFASIRWMDDIWLFEDNEARLRACVAEVEGILAQLHLSLNSEKTRFYERKDAQEIVRLIDDSSGNNAVPAELSHVNPEDAPRFWLSLTASQMLRTRNFKPISQLTSDNLEQFTYAADRLAEVLKASGFWELHIDWYLKYIAQHIASDDWSVAAWGEMFPLAPSGGIKRVRDCFSDRQPTQLQRILVPLVAQRLSVWDSVYGPSWLSDPSIFLAQEDPFRLRALIFASLSNGVNKNALRLVAESQCDEITLMFLEDTDFKAPIISRRFQT